ncbi:phosphatidate cytidylyltransferase [Sphingomonas sp. MMS24-JH45]
MSIQNPLPDAPDAKLRTPSNLRLRMIASVVMIAVASAALVMGGFAFWLLAVVVALFMMAEWSDLQKVPPKTKRLAQFALSVPLATMAPAWLILEPRDFFTLGLLAGAAFFVVIVTRLPRLALGVLYCGLPVMALIVLRRQDAGLLFAFWTMALVWATDIGAFFADAASAGRARAAAQPQQDLGGAVRRHGGGNAAGAGAARGGTAGRTGRRDATAGRRGAARRSLRKLAEADRGGQGFRATRCRARRCARPDDGLVPVAPVAVLIVLLLP